MMQIDQAVLDDIGEALGVDTSMDGVKVTSSGGPDIELSDCGANAPGGGGFTKGNTCAKGSGGRRTASGEASGEAKPEVDAAEPKADIHSRRQSRIAKAAAELPDYEESEDPIYLETEYEVNGRRFRSLLDTKPAIYGSGYKDPLFLLDDHGINVMEFIFEDEDGETSKTGKGGAIKVFRKVGASVHKALYDTPEVEALYFTSNEMYGESSRTDLYEFMTSRAPKVYPGYVGLSKVKSFGRSQMGKFIIFPADKLTDELRGAIAANLDLTLYEAE
jgi:hypothetical protein